MNPAPGPQSFPPGWYPDPSGAPLQRYWDGTTWTAQTAGGLPVTAPQAAGRSGQSWVPWTIATVAVVLALIAVLVAWSMRPSRMGQPGQPGQRSHPVAMSAHVVDRGGLELDHRL